MNKLTKPFLLLGIIALITALWGGLQRMGVAMPFLNLAIPLSHGQLMIGGFLGTVISLERAVAMKKSWYFLAPMFAGLGSLFLLFGFLPSLAITFIFTASIILVLTFIVLVKQFPHLHMGVMAYGALFWLWGNILWLAGFPIAVLVPWWIAFLVVTIAGERLELSRILIITPKKKKLFLSGLGIYSLGILISLFEYRLGIMINGAGMIALAAWMLSYDMARKTVKVPGLSSFIAQSLLVGYVWLGIGGAIAIFSKGETAGMYYDAELHSVLVGFVFSMIFGHAPIIFPAILRVKMLFSKRFYIHLYLLHASLALRVLADLVEWIPGRQWGGILSAIAIVLFFLNTVTSIRKLTFDLPATNK